MAQTNVPQLQFTAAGVVAPAEADILAGVQADQDAAFGGGLNPGLTTPQGQLAISLAAIIGAKNDALLNLVNMVDPACSDGRYQDALARIYFLKRKPAQATTAACICVGAQSTVIPAGALASDGTNVWICQETGVIPAGGSITLPFACAVTGPIACPANSVSAIYQTIPGWDAITNPSEGVIGANVESRADFEHRRQLSVSRNAVGPIQSIVAEVLNVPGVVDAYGYQNDTSTDVTIGGVTIAKNSIFICVSGGDPQAVAQAIWRKKIPGGGYSGATTVTVYDTSNNYAPPYPAYSVKFQTAAALAIKVAVNLVNSAQVPGNAATLIQNAIIAAFAGADGGPRARIGQAFLASRLYAGVAALGAWAQIIDILVGTSTPTAYSVAVPIDHAPTVAATDITVTLT